MQCFEISGGQMPQMPPWLRACRTPTLVVFFWFSVEIVVFVFIGVYSAHVGFKHSHSHPDSPSFLNLFLSSKCWLVGPLKPLVTSLVIADHFNRYCIKMYM